jgi:hypothetical protein
MSRRSSKAMMGDYDWQTLGSNSRIVGVFVQTNPVVFQYHIEMAFLKKVEDFEHGT